MSQETTTQYRDDVKSQTTNKSLETKEEAETKLELSKIIARSVIRKLEIKVKQIIKEEKRQKDILTDIQDLSTNINTLKSNDDLEQIFIDFIQGLEEQPETQGLHSLNYEAEQILEGTRIEIFEALQDESGEGILGIYSELRTLRSIRPLNKEKKEDSKVIAYIKDFFKAIKRIAKSPITGPKSIMTATKKRETDALGLAKNLAIGEGVAVAHPLLAGISNFPEINKAFKYSAALVFASYTVIIALLLAAEEGKVTRGSTSLEKLSGFLVEYSEQFPEALAVSKKIIENLKEGIEETGKFRDSEESIRAMYDSSVFFTDIEKLIANDNKGSMYEGLGGLSESCREGLSPSMKKLINIGGKVTIALASLAGETIEESAILGATTAVTITFLQQVVRDIDKPYGEGSMRLSTEPLDAALANLKIIEEKHKISKRVQEKIEEQERVDQNIVNSFYKDFRKIFDPYCSELEKAEKIMEICITTNAHSQATEGGAQLNFFKAAEIYGEAEKGKNQTIQKIEEKNSPEFLFGQKIVNAKQINMARQIGFRHDDDPKRQLALLEGVCQKISKETNMNPKQKGMALDFIKEWIERVNLQKILIQEGKEQKSEKDKGQEIQNAVNAISGEIKDNIREKGSAEYVAKRRKGSQKLGTQTANRSTDWLPENQEQLLTPIQTDVIARLQAAAQSDSENAEKYQQVITQINNARKKAKLSEITIQQEIPTEA